MGAGEVGAGGGGRDGRHLGGLVARRALAALYSTILQWLHPLSIQYRRGGYGPSRPGGNFGFRV